jgi:hypothetical protein
VGNVCSFSIFGRTSKGFVVVLLLFQAAPGALLPKPQPQAQYNSLLRSAGPGLSLLGNFFFFFVVLGMEPRVLHMPHLSHVQRFLITDLVSCWVFHDIVMADLVPRYDELD